MVISDPKILSTSNGYINSLHHHATALTALSAIFPSAVMCLFFTDLFAAGLESHKIRRLYVHGTEKTGTWEDISDKLDIIINAQEKNISQLGEWDLGNMMRKRAA